MTFDINSLNNAYVPAGYMNGYYQFGHGQPTPFYANGAFNFTYPGYHYGLGGSYKITVENSTYYAPSVVNGHQYTAVFGELHFTTYVNGTGQANGFDFVVTGFNGNSLLGFQSGLDGALPPMYNGHFLGSYTESSQIGPNYYSGLKGGTEIINFSQFPSYPTTLYTTNAAADAAGVTFVPPCFAEGTQVLTARGECKVEDLTVGDEVITASGATRPVIWIGSRRIKVAAYHNPQDVNPVRIRAGAFADAVPARDLLLSPGHAIFVAGVLVPAGYLVNGATIVQDSVETVRYFHIELDAHDVLLAEGLTCESYLDDGNREVFANGREHVALYGRLDPVAWDGACAPVLRDWQADHAQLTAIKVRLHERALALGWVLATDANLCLLADGCVIAPLRVAGHRAWFEAPAAASLTLTSHAARPFDVIPGQLDCRTLGVAVGEVRVDGVSLALDGEAFGEGFMPVERQGDVAWRWTNGAADLYVQGPALLEVALQMTAPSWVRPATQTRLRLVQTA